MSRLLLIRRILDTEARHSVQTESGSNLENEDYRWYTEEKLDKFALR
jgi:hypothetical protein